MKSAGKSLAILAVLFLLLQTPAHAEEHESGFFGNILLGGGVVTGKPSQLEVADDNEVVNRLSEQADRDTQGIPVVMGELGYYFAGTGTQISLGTESRRGDEFALAVGQSMGGLGTLRVTGSFGQMEVWKDPYLTGVKRQETDEDTISGEVAWEEILGSGATAWVAGSTHEVDDDFIGRRHADLRRDGESFASGISYTFDLSENQALTPHFEMSLDERDGDANTNAGYEVGLSHVLGLGHFVFETSLAYGQKEYDKRHPVFNRTRDEDMFSVSEFITYMEPFGMQGFSITALVAYSRTDANIEFFDSDQLVVGAGVGYSF